MNSEEIIKLLNEYHEDEIFYKAYYEAKQKNEVTQFLMNYSYDELLKRKLIIEEIKNGWMPVYMDDDMLFDNNDPHDICLSKHFRYTPVFNHKHIFFELVYVVSGHCQQIINGKEMTLTQGQFCIISPLTSHSIGVFDDSIILNIIIRRKTFIEIFNNLLRHSNKITDFVNQSLYLVQQANYIIMDTNRDVVLRNMVLDMYIQYTHKKKFNELLLNTELMLLISKILQDYEDKIEIPHKPYNGNKEILNIITYIEKNYKTATLVDVSETFNYSQSYLSRLIKKETGKSFTEIVLSLKFDKARTMLETTNISINEIAYLTGFENNENFYRLFKKRFHMTPGDYRNHCKI